VHVFVKQTTVPRFQVAGERSKQGLKRGKTSHPAATRQSKPSCAVGSEQRYARLPAGQARFAPPVGAAFPVGRGWELQGQNPAAGSSLAGELQAVRIRTWPPRSSTRFTCRQDRARPRLPGRRESQARLLARRCCSAASVPST